MTDLSFDSPFEPGEETVPKKKTIAGMLLDPGVPMKMRKHLLRQLASTEGETEDGLVERVLESAASSSDAAQSVAAEKAQELDEKLRELKQGPLRSATFVRALPAEAGGRRAEVLLPDGAQVFCAVPQDGMLAELRCGDTVLLDGQGTALLYRGAEARRLGEEARLERRLPGGELEVTVGELGRYVYLPTDALRDQIERGDAEVGCTLVVCPRRMIAWYALPPAEGEGHRRFLSSASVPDVQLGRDVGAPPPFIEDLALHVERELDAPGISRRHGLRRSRLLLATGVPGSGKSHAIKALWRRLYEVMGERTGVPVEELPRRVFQLAAADVLSKWLGDSDQNIARFFDEVAETAGETFVAPDGREWTLPVLVVCEEIDALARQRGEDAVHDRIQTTLLTRLDPAQALYEDQLVIVICTSNVAGSLDSAFVRRAGAEVASFGRLSRFEFRAVLARQLARRPVAGGEEGLGRAIADLTAWLFAPNGDDPGQVEVTYVGQPTAEPKYRRDFLTAGLVDRAVQHAAARACDEEYQSGAPVDLTSERLREAIEGQVRAIVDQLTPGNCEQYLTLPDAMRVGTVRRIPQPVASPVALERAS